MFYSILNVFMDIGDTPKSKSRAFDTYTKLINESMEK